MYAVSSGYPKQFVRSKNKLFYNYNIVEAIEEDEEGTRTVFKYDYVEVAGEDRSSLIEALIRAKYSISDELALIHNQIRGERKDIAAYRIYQDYRAYVKYLIS